MRNRGRPDVDLPLFRSSCVKSHSPFPEASSATHLMRQAM